MNIFAMCQFRLDMHSLYLSNNFWVQSLKTPRSCSVKRETRNLISPQPLCLLCIALGQQLGMKISVKASTETDIYVVTDLVQPLSCLCSLLRISLHSSRQVMQKLHLCLLIQLIFKWAQGVSYSPHATSLCTQMLQLININL